MSFIAIALIALSLVALAAAAITTARAEARMGGHAPIGLTYRAYGA